MRVAAHRVNSTGKITHVKKFGVKQLFMSLQDSNQTFMITNASVQSFGAVKTLINQGKDAIIIKWGVVKEFLLKV